MTMMIKMMSCSRCTSGSSSRAQGAECQTPCSQIAKSSLHKASARATGRLSAVRLRSRAAEPRHGSDGEVTLKTGWYCSGRRGTGPASAIRRCGGCRPRGHAFPCSHSTAAGRDSCRRGSQPQFRLPSGPSPGCAERRAATEHPHAFCFAISAGTGKKTGKALGLADCCLLGISILGFRRHGPA